MVNITKRLMILAVVLSAFPAFAADEAPAPRLWLVHQEIVKPSMLEQYEANTKDFMALVKQHKSKMPHFNITGAFQGDDLMYTYSIPITSLADLDHIAREFAAMTEAGGEKAAEITRKGGAATEQMKEWVLLEPTHMGYVPAQPRLKREEMKYLHYDLYYVQPGKEAEADALSLEFVKLFTSKAVPNGYRLFKVLIGEDLSLYAVQIAAKDAADFAIEDAKVRQLLGKEGEALFARAYSLCRRVESSNAWFRPDLTNAEPPK